MKKILVFLIAFSTLTGIETLRADETTTKKAKSEMTANTENQLTKAEAKALVSRLKEIKGMAKSNLTADEKKSLRSEVVTIQKQLQHQSSVILVISGTALLIIILLLLLL